MVLPDLPHEPVVPMMVPVSLGKRIAASALFAVSLPPTMALTT